MLTAMPRKALQRLLPDPSRFAGHRSLRLLRGRLHDPNLWYLTRHSVSTAVFIGLFIALIPMPLQMLTAALLALWWRANLAISVALEIGRACVGKECRSRGAGGDRREQGRQERWCSESY